MDIIYTLKMYKEINNADIFGKLLPEKKFEKFYFMYPRQKCRIIND